MKKVTNKIIHIPYIEFTHNEVAGIDISPITIYTDTVLDLVIDYDYEIMQNFNGRYPGILGNQYPYSVNDNHRFVIWTPRYALDNKTFYNYYLFGTEYSMYSFENYNKDINPKHIRIEPRIAYINNVSQKRSSNLVLSDMNFKVNFYLGGTGSAGAGFQPMKGKIYYVRFERKNSLYRHYLPCVRFYNIVDDDNNLIAENLIDWGYFESVNQDYYIVDSNSIPAHNGNSLLSDFSNLLDINGNVIDYQGGGE